MVDTRDFKKGGSSRVYSDCRLYGPYIGKDNRYRIILIFPDKVRKTVSYPKYLMEVHLNRYLDEYETVDHINGDTTDNELSNLRVLPRREHAIQDTVRLKACEFICPMCESKFKLEGISLNEAISNRKRKKAGPFCGKSCSGLYGAMIQNGGDKFRIMEIQAEYIKLKDSKEPDIGNNISGGS